MRGVVAPTADTTATLKKDTAKRACCRVRSRIPQPLRPAGAGRPLTRRPTLGMLILGSYPPCNYRSKRFRLRNRSGQSVAITLSRPCATVYRPPTLQSIGCLTGDPAPLVSLTGQEQGCLTQVVGRPPGRPSTFHVEHQPPRASTSPSDTPSGSSVACHAPVPLSNLRMSPSSGVTANVTSERSSKDALPITVSTRSSV